MDQFMQTQREKRNKVRDLIESQEIELMNDLPEKLKHVDGKQRCVSEKRDIINSEKVRNLHMRN